MKSIILLALVMLFALPSFARISVSPGYLQFGSVKVGGYGGGSRTVYVQNYSANPVSVSVTGFCMDFRVNNFCTGTVYPHSSCSMMIDYRPTQVGYDSCSLTLRDSEGDYQTLSISGNAVK